jgi:hypothetical protein
MLIGGRRFTATRPPGMIHINRRVRDYPECRLDRGRGKCGYFVCSTATYGGLSWNSDRTTKIRSHISIRANQSCDSLLSITRLQVSAMKLHRLDVLGSLGKALASCYLGSQACTPRLSHDSYTLTTHSLDDRERFSIGTRTYTAGTFSQSFTISGVMQTRGVLRRKRAADCPAECVTRFNLYDNQYTPNIAGHGRISSCLNILILVMRFGSFTPVRTMFSRNIRKIVVAVVLS